MHIYFESAKSVFFILSAIFFKGSRFMHHAHIQKMGRGEAISKENFSPPDKVVL